MNDGHQADSSAHAAVREALLGVQDNAVRVAFIGRFHEQLDSFERTMTDVYARWLRFESDFAKDHDSATVVGALFTVVARALLSMKLLMLGQLTVSGSAQRQAYEALALAFLFAQHGWPYRQQIWDGQFSTNNALLDQRYFQLTQLRSRSSTLPWMRLPPRTRVCGSFSLEKLPGSDECGRN